MLTGWCVIWTDEAGYEQRREFLERDYDQAHELEKSLVLRAQRRNVAVREAREQNLPPPGPVMTVYLARLYA